MTYPNNLRPKAQIVGTHIFVIYKVLPTLFLRYMPNYFTDYNVFLQNRCKGTTFF